MATPTTYKVQKGDTLSGIAKKLGVSTGDLSGYRSGNKDLIYEGETLTYGAPKSEASSYAEEVSAGLGEETTPKKGSSLYDSSTLKKEKEEYKSGLDSAFKKLQKVQEDTFESEYEKSNLKEKKQKMETLDSSIATKRAERDAALAKVKANPGLSAAQMTGDIARMTELANADINNLIQERNSVAGEYNAGLDEIDKKVQRAAGSAKAEYDYYAGLLGNTTSTLSEYSKALADELKSDTQADQFDRQLAQALEIAQMKGSGGGSNLSLARDPRTGDPLYWFDPDTGEITWVDDGGTDTGGDDFDSDFGAEVQAAQDGGGTKATWWNPFTWANAFD